MPFLLRFWKSLALTALLLPCLGGATHGQSRPTDDVAYINNIVDTYTLPLNRNGLTESAFRIKVKVTMSRWQSKADIILAINSQQGSSQNPDPSFKHSYNYHGKLYGDQHVGQGVFQGVRAGMVHYKVTVMCNGQTWTSVVDGLGNQFGPVARDTKASAVTVFVEVASVGEFLGNDRIETAIQSIIQREADAKAAEQARLRKAAEDQRAAEQARLRKAAEDKRVAEQARLQKEADARAAAAARQASTARTSTTGARASTTSAKAGSTAAKTGNASSASASTTAGAKTTASSARTSSPGGTSQDAARTEADTQAEQARTAARDATTREAARDEAERQRKAAEEAAAQQRQADYDQWKAKKKEEQAQAEATAVAGTIGVAAMLAELLYADMGKVDPDFVYRPTNRANYHAPRFFVNTQFGLTGTVMPMLFESSVSTMQKGKSVTTESVKDVQPLWINLEGIAQVGAESDLYGGYAYWRPKFGISPILTGYNLSVLSGGVRVFAGSPGVKLYADISRNYFSASRSDNDAEELGKGEFDFLLRKRTELGVRFTVHHADYVRSHISLGFIWERLDGDGDTNFHYVSKDGTALLSGATPSTLGYSLSWKQDHSHQFYVNYFPNYWLAGNVAKPKNFSSSHYTGSYSSGPVGTLLEFGFIRSIDWFN